MPIEGAKYRFKKMKGGKAMRLAFKGKKVVEATPFKKNKEGILKKVGDSTKAKIGSLADKLFRK